MGTLCVQFMQTSLWLWTLCLYFNHSANFFSIVMLLELLFFPGKTPALWHGASNEKFLHSEPFLRIIEKSPSLEKISEIIQYKKLVLRGKMGSLRTTPSSCIAKLVTKTNASVEINGLFFAVQLFSLVVYDRHPSAPLLNYCSWWQWDIDSWGFKAVTYFCCIFCLLLFLCMIRYCKWCSVSLYKTIKTSDFKVQCKRSVWTNSAHLSNSSTESWSFDFPLDFVVSC